MRDWGTKIHILTWSRCADRATRNCMVIYHGEGGVITVLNNQFYRLAYEFHKRWAPFPATVDDWCKAAEEAAKACAAHGNDEFLKGLLETVYSDFERQYKAERGEGAA